MRIQTVADLVVRLGGSREAAAFFGTYPQRVDSWRLRNKFPAYLVLVHKRLLRARGYQMPDELWLRPPRIKVKESGTALSAGS